MVVGNREDYGYGWGIRWGIRVRIVEGGGGSGRMVVEGDGVFGELWLRVGAINGVKNQKTSSR